MCAAVLIPAAVMQHTEASSSWSRPAVDMNSENHCYATKNYVPDDKPSSVSVDVVVDDVSVTSGFLQNALWSSLSDGRFIETGFLDQPHDSEKIVCGENGGIDRSASISFSDGHVFNAYVYELHNGMVWKTGIEHSNSSAEKSCTVTSPAGTHMEKFRIGSEASQPSNPNYEHEWNDLEIDYQGISWDDFSNVWVSEYGPGYDVEECSGGGGQYRHIQTDRYLTVGDYLPHGPGDERYRHIQTGKGDISVC